MKIPISSRINNKLLAILGIITTLGENSPSSVLCYHSISNGKWEYSLSPKLFESQIRYLIIKHKVVSLKKLIGACGNNMIAITFDDGYEDVYNFALPILSKYNLSACVFIIGDKDKVNRNQLRTSKKLLNIKQIKRLKKLGWEIGYHSETHEDLVNLDKKKLEREIIDGKKKLEKQLREKIKYFAYPHGKYSNRIIDVVKKAGFDAAFTIDGGAISKSLFPYKFNRVTVDRYLEIENFRILLTKWGLLYNAFHTQLLKVKDNIYCLIN